MREKRAGTWTFHFARLSTLALAGTNASKRSCTEDREPANEGAHSHRLLAREICHHFKRDHVQIEYGTNISIINLPEDVSRLLFQNLPTRHFDYFKYPIFDDDGTLPPSTPIPTLFHLLSQPSLQLPLQALFGSLYATDCFLIFSPFRFQISPIRPLPS